MFWTEGTHLSQLYNMGFHKSLPSLHQSHTQRKTTSTGAAGMEYKCLLQLTAKLMADFKFGKEDGSDLATRQILDAD